MNFIVIEYPDMWTVPDNGCEHEYDADDPLNICDGSVSYECVCCGQELVFHSG